MASLKGIEPDPLDQALSVETTTRDDGRRAAVIRDKTTGRVAYPSYVPPQTQVPKSNSPGPASTEPSEPPPPGYAPTKTQSSPMERVSGDEPDHQAARPHREQRAMSEGTPFRAAREDSGFPPRLQRARTHNPDFQKALWRAEHDGSSSSSSEDESFHEPLTRTEKKKLKKQAKSRQPSSDPYTKFRVGNDNYHTKGKVKRDGRLSISVNDTSSTGYLAKAIGSAVKKVVPRPKAESDTEDVDDAATSRISRMSSVTTAGLENVPCPKLNIVIMVIGSRGDAQPFLRIGQVLKEQYGHRVRIATHPAFKDFVEKDSGLEFFSVGGDPSELMAFMVKNPGMIPTLETVKAGDIGRRRAAMAEMFEGFWRACIHATDDPKDEQNLRLMGDKPPFVADAIIANPPSFAHYHIAEALGIPLHLMFTFPYTPTQAFPHPLAIIRKSNVDPGYTNFISYPLVEMMVWQGLGDLVNDFRVKTLDLDPVSTLWAPGATYRLHVPFTYLWSPGLVPKPEDWGDEVDVSGFVFLDLASSFKPPDDLVKFLDSGEKPIYIGFGSIVVDDPNSFTEMIFEAVKLAGVRALVSKGWGKLGGDNVPDNIYMLENTPHDWLFPRVSACVIHGGAGTTAIALKCGRPTMVVPFFGDQHFWGSMLERSGAGPKSVPYKHLTAEKLAEGIKYCLSEEAQEAAAEIAKDIEHEGDGAENACRAFHKNLTLQGTHSMRCCILEDRVATWHLKHTNIRLSAIAADILTNNGHIPWRKLKLIRHREWNDFEGPGEPVTGLAGSLVTSIGEVVGGVGSVPLRLAKSSHKRKERREKKKKHQERHEGQVKHEDEKTDHQVSNKEPSPMASKSNAENGDQETKENSTGDTAKPQQEVGAANIKNEKSNKTDPEVPETNSSASPPKETEVQDHAQASKQPPEQSPQPNNCRDSDACSMSTTGTRDTLEISPVSDFVKNVKKGVGKSAHALARAPVDMSLAVAQGFHNAPRLYGDDTVRRPMRVTGMRSGLRAARSEFAYGVYDAFTGVVRMPVRGARDGGVKGFTKGVGMGLMGFILKNFAAIAGPGAYTLKGMAKELERGRGPIRYLRRARLVQSQWEQREMRPEDRQRLAERTLEGWGVMRQLARALEEAQRRQAGGLRGRLSARRRRGIGAAFESVEIAQSALEAVRRGDLEKVVEKGVARESDGRNKVERKVKREKKKEIAEHAGEKRRENKERDDEVRKSQDQEHRSDKKDGEGEAKTSPKGGEASVKGKSKAANGNGTANGHIKIAFAEEPRIERSSDSDTVVTAPAEAAS